MVKTVKTMVSGWDFPLNQSTSGIPLQLTHGSSSMSYEFILKLMLHMKQSKNGGNINGAICCQQTVCMVHDSVRSAKTMDWASLEVMVVVVNII